MIKKVKYQKNPSIWKLDFVIKITIRKNYIYENIKGTCSFSSGCNSLQLDSEFDGGRAKVSGFESRLAKLYSWDNIHFPLAFNWTVTRANFDSESVSANPEWGIGTIKKGDPLPYVPKANYSFSLGTQYKRYSQEFIFNWTGEMYDQSVEANRQMIPSQGVVDWSGKFQFQVNSQIYARIDNCLLVVFACSPNFID